MYPNSWTLRNQLAAEGQRLVRLYAVRAAHRMLLTRARRAAVEGRHRDAAVCLRLAGCMRRELVFMRSGGYDS